MAMTMLLRIGLVLAVGLLPLGHRCIAGDNGALPLSVKAVKTDFGNFYMNRTNLIKLGIGVAGAAALANTGADRYIRNKYQDDLRSTKTDDATKLFNARTLTLASVLGPGYVVAYGAGVWFDNPTMEEWAQKSFRATLVGAPALGLLAGVTGGGRPTTGDSRWKPFENFNGISGHSYFTTIPFLTAAKMSENPYQKAIFYVLSTLPALSRVNDDKHYFSQVAVAWYLAYLSCAAVEKGDDRQEARLHVQFAAVPNGIAMAVRKSF
jgi:membrane-associated phospholipid phosphatase